MSTHDVPGANPANADELGMGNWAEHRDGSLLFVKGLEAGKVVYELYDLAEVPPMYYQDAMPEDRFKHYFNHGPAGTRKDDWTWRDKTSFPWDKVMKRLSRPRPQHADVEEQISAARRVAEDLGRRGRRVDERDIAHRTSSERPRDMLQRFRDAVEEFTR